MPSRKQKSESDMVLSELMNSLPLVQAHGLCLLKRDPAKVVQIIDEELNRLECWLGMERHFGAMGSALYTEKAYYVIEIASAAAKGGSFHLSATLYALLVRLAANTALLTNRADAEVENLSTDVFDSLKDWIPELIPLDEINPTLNILKKASVYTSVVDSGLSDPFIDSFSHIQNYQNL